MARYCKKCGKQLMDGEKCSCRSELNVQEILHVVKSFIVTMLKRMGIGAPSENSSTIFESGQSIVPDIAKANEGETPIKQYEVAVMRSRVRGHYAKGKLQVTNKRVLFRAAGFSLQGPIAQQYEFSINEIAGIEIKKKKRISIMNLIVGFYLNLIGTFIGLALFETLAETQPTLAFLIALSLAGACAIPFFALHKKFWLKLLALSIGSGALAAVAVADLSFTDFLFGFPDLTANIFLSGPYHILWLINLVLVATVPDLVLIVKTKGSGPAFEIRRKQFPTMFKPMVEYTDFGEVLPGKDVDTVIAELGAMIDDIQTLGDMAIDKWKEN